MRRKPVRFTALMLALTLASGTATAARAACSRQSPELAAASSQHMKISAPTNNAVYYKGESIPFTLTVKRLDRDFWVSGSASLDRYRWYERFHSTGFTLREKFNSKNLSTGYHTFSAAMSVVYVGSDSGQSGSYTERVTSRISLRTLKAPGSPKAAAGKGKVTVTWKKAAGASKYEVFRSATKAGKYKRIATVKTNTRADKNVARGKKYFYKVRAVRDVHGTVRSGYSAIAPSGKVK